MSDKKQFVVVFPRGVEPQQIDDFPAGCERSTTSGALHIAPGSYTLTKDEIKHIRKHYKNLAKRFKIAKELDPGKAEVGKMSDKEVKSITPKSEKPEK